MPYIGKQLVRGQNRELDDISGSFNGSNTVFNLTVGGDSITPGSALQLFISVGGVLQNPNTDFTVAGNQITFSTAPGSGLSFFGILQGDAVDFNTPADGSVTTAKLGSNLTINVADGTAATPSIQFNGSGTDTGFYSPTTDEIGASVAGGEALRIDSSGRLLVGTSTSASSAGAAAIEIIGDGTRGGELCLGRNDDTILADQSIGFITFRGNDNNGTYEQCAEISAYSDSSHATGSKPTRLVFSTTADGASSPTERMRIESNGNVRFPSVATIYQAGGGGINLGNTGLFSTNGSGTLQDNTKNLGSAIFRWSVVYAGTGTINTSDVTLKQDIESLDVAELNVAAAIKGLIKKFRFTDAVNEKGDDARIHIGVIAQEVEQAFVAEGLDPRRYGLFCEDTLEDGSKRLGIRYDELLAFVIAALQ